MTHNPLSSDKNKAKITDVVYGDYMERTNEWKNKLDSFEQKYHAIHRTTEPDSDLVRIGKSRKIEY